MEGRGINNVIKEFCEIGRAVWILSCNLSKGFIIYKKRQEILLKG